MFFVYQDVNKDSFVSNTYLTAVGKIPTFVAGDKKYEKIVAIANMKIDEWARETDWKSLYDPKYSLGTVSATDTYDVDDEVEKVTASPGDYVLIRTTSGDIGYQIVTPDRLKATGGRVCAFMGRSLVFSKPFEQGAAEYGGTILVPVKMRPGKLVRANDVVVVDDPNWLVKITAAEWVRNDTVRLNQYPNLVAEANALMENMKEANDESQFSQVLVDMPFIGRSW